jgi:hypothetical protein
VKWRAVRSGAYRSKFEESIAVQLQDAGVTFRHEMVRLPYERPAVYTPDFQVTTASGKVFFVEAKGYFPPSARQKMLDVKRAHPDLDIRLVLQTPRSRLNPKSGTTYAKWAETSGFRWADSKGWLAWLEE